MAWNSINLMTGVDVVIVAVTIYAGYRVFCAGRRVPGAGQGGAFDRGLVALGLTVIALFFAADLYTMWVMPQLVDGRAAMTAMETLHLEFSWFVFPVAVVCIAAGFILMNRRLDAAVARSQGSETRFQTVFENSGIGIAIRNNRDRALLVNSAFEKMMGYSREELQQMQFRNFTHPDDQPANKEAREKLQAGEVDSIQTTKRYIRKDGEMIWVTREMSAVRDAGGRLEYTMSLYLDVTDRMRAEEEAAEKSRLLEATFENMAQGVAVYDADHMLVAFNPQYADILDLPPGFLRTGMSRDEILRYRAELGQFAGGEVDATVERRLAASAEPVSTERTLPNGRSFSCEIMPMPDGGYIITLTDITARKRTEREAAEQARVLEVTFENMAQGIAVYDADDTLIAFNRQYEEIMGLPPGDVHVGMHRGDLIRARALSRGEDEADIEARITEQLAGTGVSASGERTLADGRTYFYEHTPMPGGGFISTLTDVTERREAETRLQQAMKMEAVGQLTGGIAHDFNNLLAISLGNIDLAEDAVRQGSDVWPFLEAVRGAGERGASLTSQLLSFSRKQTLFPETIDAGDLVGSLTNLLRRTLGENIEIRVAGDDDLWPCEADPNLLENALLNLAINARDAMPVGGTLGLETSNVSLNDDYAAAQAEVEPGDYVMIAVTDTGVGMPKDVLAHVFDPFFTTKEAGRGSGLGLSMVYGFVKQSRGHVTVYSEEGKGTSIKLYLPRSEESEAAPTVPEKAEFPDARGETVLVVEDDPDVRTLSVALLRSLGYQIEAAADGAGALKIFDATPRINLLFTDVVLPGGMSGPQLAAEVRRRHPGMAVLYTSGYTDLANFESSAFGDDVELLQKPYRKADLARKIRTAIDRATK